MNFRSRLLRSWWLRASALLALGAAALPAQQTISTRRYRVITQPVPRGPTPAVPAPPRALVDAPHKHRMPPIPEGPYRTLEGPQTAARIELPSQIAAAGDYEVFLTRDVRPSLTGQNAFDSRSRVAEPSINHVDADVAFLTANWFAAKTDDGGQSWSHIHPYVQFFLPWGAFCCDQRFLSDGTTSVWTLQYQQDVLGNSGYQFAVANDATGVATNTWDRVVALDPQDVGYPDDRWFDFPDVAFTDAHFVVSANVYDGNGGNQGSMLMRMPIQQMRGNGPVDVEILDGSDGSLGFNFRLGQSAGDTLFAACHKDTSTLRVFAWPDNSAAATLHEVPIASWTRGLSAAPGPDGGDWTGRADHRVLGGWSHGDRAGFLWNCGPQSGRPQNYVRHCVVDTTDFTVAWEDDLYDGTSAVLYPAAATNHWGHVAVVVAIGGGNLYPTAGTVLYDDLEQGDTIRVFATGTADPGQSEWSDYLTMQGFPTSEAGGTFVCSGQRQGGGGGRRNARVVYTHFGRNAFQADGTGVIVRSEPIPVAVSMSVTDLEGQRNGTTPFYRRYAVGTQPQLTAPRARTVGGIDYGFHHWTHEFEPGAAPNVRPTGRLTVIAGVGTTDDRWTATYEQVRTLTIDTSANVSGLRIDVSPGDFDGNGGGGLAPLTRRFLETEEVTLTAPSAADLRRFSHWTVDGVARAADQRTLTLTVSGDHTLVAHYLEPLCYEPDLGTALGMGDESIGTGLALGFDFPLLDGSTTGAVSVCSNGYLWLSGATSTIDPSPSAAEFLTGAPRIAAAWHDMTFDGGESDVFFNALPGRAVITWQRARATSQPANGAQHLHTVQCQLFEDGQVHLTCSGDVSRLDEVLTGVHGGTDPTDPGPADFSSESFGSGTVPSLYEQFAFATRRFDLGGRVLHLEPNTRGGLDGATGESDCQLGAVSSYGAGCPLPGSFLQFGSAANLVDRSIELLPNSSGGYQVNWCTTGCYETALGQRVIRSNEALHLEALPFAFPFPGNASGTTGIQVCSNGYVWLDPSASRSDPTATVSEFLREAPRLAPFWTDLYPGEVFSDGVYVNTTANRCVITWHQIAEAGFPNRLIDVQVQLFAGGRVLIAYHGDLTTLRDVLVGFTPGEGSSNPGSRDLAASIPFATGPGGQSPLELSAGGYLPAIGQPFLMQLDPLPASSLVGAMVLGFLPDNIELSPIGMPGCFKLTTGDVDLPLALAATGPTTTLLPIPDDLALVGLTVFVQSVVLAPGMNPLGAITSNGLQLTIGQR